MPSKSNPIVPLLCAALSACASTERTFTWDQGAIVRGDRATAELALIFTGGEFGEGTEHILDVLAERSIRASFFLTGDYLANRAHVRSVHRMIRDRHYVGPHSHAHLLYCAWEDRQRTLVTQTEFVTDLRANLTELRALGALPDQQPIFFIPPYEWFNAEQVEWSRDLGIITFCFTPGSGSQRDWIPEGHPRFVSAERIVDDILACEQRDPDGLNGFLLLLHLGSGRSDPVHPHLARLLDALLARGYRFTTVTDLLHEAT